MHWIDSDVHCAGVIVVEWRYTCVFSGVTLLSVVAIFLRTMALVE